MSCKEEGRKSVLSSKNDDSDWSDIDTDGEDEQGTESKRLKIDLVILLFTASWATAFGLCKSW